MEQSLAKIMDNDENLRQYINTLELDIENTKNVDEEIDLILHNILVSFSDFTDRRSLKASNIEAITNLLKLKSELPMKRIQSKKLILDMLSKKTELEIKNKSAEANTELAMSTSDFLKNVFLMLDQNKIHPKLEEDSKIDVDCEDIIDVQIEENLDIDNINNIENSEECIKNEIEDELKNINKINIEEIQEQLDNLDNQQRGC